MLAAFLLALAGDPRLVLAPDVEVGVGYDDNLFLNPDLVSATGGAVGDAILHVAPRVPLALIVDGGHSLTLTYDGFLHEPLSGSYGVIADELFTLEYRTPEIDTGWAPLVLRVEGLGERYDATFTSNGTIFNYDAFWLAGVEAGALMVGRAGRGGLAYRYQARNYANRDQQDVEHRIFATYEARPLPHLSAGASYTFTYVQSEQGGATDFLDGARRHRFALPLRADFLSNAFAVRVEPSISVQTLPSFTSPPPPPPCMPGVVTPTCPPVQRHDLILGLVVAASLRFSDNFDLFLRADILRSTSDDELPPTAGMPLGTPGTGSFSRIQMMFGVIGHFSLASSPPALPSSVAESPEERPYLPRRQASGSIRFRLKAAGAQKVEILGEWNQWQPEALAAAPEGGDLWQVDLTLPTGRYAYSFVVDGQSEKPPDAEAYVSDGFGGTNGVIEVTP